MNTNVDEIPNLIHWGNWANIQQDLWRLGYTHEDQEALYVAHLESEGKPPLKDEWEYSAQRNGIIDGGTPLKMIYFFDRLLDSLNK